MPSDQTTLDDLQAMTLLEDQVRLFRNESIGRRLTPEQWGHEFERWMSRHPLARAWEEELTWQEELARHGE